MDRRRRAIRSPHGSWDTIESRVHSVVMRSARCELGVSLGLGSVQGALLHATSSSQVTVDMGTEVSVYQRATAVKAVPARRSVSPNACKEIQVKRVDIYLAALVDGQRIPVVKVVRSPETLDHVIVDRSSSSGGCKVTYHGNGHSHLQDPCAPRTWMDESRVNAAKLQGWKRAEEHVGYRGGCGSGPAVAELKEPEHVCALVYRSPRQFLDERMYTRRKVANVVEMELDSNAIDVEIGIYLCPHASLDQLRSRYAKCSAFTGVEPAVVFCSGLIDHSPSCGTIGPG